MRVSLKWLRDLVDVDVPVERLKDMLDLSGTKVEAVHAPGKDVQGIVVAEVLAVHPHPNADTLTLVDVRTDAGEQRVVCGAKNFSAGDRVPLAAVGARLAGMQITARKIRGETSNGMLCSAAELGVSKDHSGILVLPRDAPVGADVTDVLGLDDTILELEITPNRGDCLGMIGVAREVGALLGHELRLPDSEFPRTEGVTNPAKVVLEDPEACPRFFAGYADGLSVGPAPAWLAARLIAAGLRPISNVVDITNYVMLETGHPVHAYDASRVAEATFVVRRARPGEMLTTLDGVERRLDTEDLLICDPRRALGLAGVMGGADSEVSGATGSVLVEVAHFDPVLITKMSRRHNLRSEASVRFERGADVDAVEYAGARVLKLLVELCSAKAAANDVDEYPVAISDRTLSLRPARTDHVLGVTTDAAHQASLLRAVGFDVEEGDVFDVVAPSWRPDVEREEDLIEEVARLAGFDRVPETLPPGRAGGLTRAQETERFIRRLLSGAGLHEAWTSSMMSAGDLELLDLPPEHSARRMVKLSNPITEDESAMRTMVLPGLLRAVSRNVAHRADGVALYELARVYEPADSAALPNETLVLGATLTGTRRARSWMHAGDHWSFFAAKGVLEAMFDALRIEDIRFRPINMMPFHPTRAAHVLIGDRPVGTAGEIHPAVCGRFDVPEGTVAFEIVLDALFERLPGRPKVDELPRYPAIYLDLAIVVDDGVAAERVAALIAAAGAPEVVGSTLFDVYRGDQIPPGKKSLAYSLELRVPDRTLTDADAVRVRDRILVALGERTGAVLRS